MLNQLPLLHRKTASMLRLHNMHLIIRACFNQFDILSNLTQYFLHVTVVGQCLVLLLEVLELESSQSDISVYFAVVCRDI